MIRLIFRRGGLFLPAAVCTEYLAHADGAALLREGADLLIIPVLRAGAGGYLLKLCSSSGDKVIHAGPFFYDNGLGVGATQANASWDEANGRLIVHDVFNTTEVGA